MPLKTLTSDMALIRISQFDGSVSEVPLARSRHAAAVLALVFPILCSAIWLAWIIPAVLTQGLVTDRQFLVSAAVSIGAAVFYFQRYWGPALTALKNPVPVCLVGNLLRVNGETFPVTDGLTIESNARLLTLNDANKVIATFPGYFIRLRR
ncbi:hypothetical protein ACOYW6_12690 [Parablastomonas sp. CN1-191]|uniref:hypothetical protein n=1 Tax=Parablastomonas sp. CN1-191 TaxID=3400908 RepID=UPI003BF89A4F